MLAPDASDVDLPLFRGSSSFAMGIQRDDGAVSTATRERSGSGSDIRTQTDVLKAEATQRDLSPGDNRRLQLKSLAALEQQTMDQESSEQQQDTDVEQGNTPSTSRARERVRALAV